MCNKKVTASLLSGIVIGTIIGVLFAPEEGSKTLKKILKKSDDLSEALRWSALTIKDAIMKTCEEDDVDLTQTFDSETSVG